MSTFVDDFLSILGTIVKAILNLTVDFLCLLLLLCAVATPMEWPWLCKDSLCDGRDQFRSHCNPRCRARVRLTVESQRARMKMKVYSESESQGQSHRILRRSVCAQESLFEPVWLCDVSMGESAGRNRCCAHGCLHRLDGYAVWDSCSILCVPRHASTYFPTQCCCYPNRAYL